MPDLTPSRGSIGRCEDTVIDKDPIRTAVRRRRIQRRFNDENPHCLICGEPELASLTAVTADWLRSHEVEIPDRLINFHHLVGEKHDRELVAPLCLNCHAKAHEGL